ncbi:MAG: MFS transporter [Pararhodobacter sp.]
MTAVHDEGSGDGRPGWRGAVAVITAFQAVLALMTRTLPLFGLPLTLMAGVPPVAAGQMAVATSLGSMLYFLWGPAFTVGISAQRQLKGGAVLTALAVLLCLSGNWGLILLGALLIGVGYGPSAPAGSDLLMRIVPARRRGLAFSIKQAGVPVGGLFAGLVLPGVAMSYGVSAALWLAAGIAFGAAVALGGWRGALARDEGPERQSALPRLADLLRTPLRLIRMILADPKLRSITYAGLGLAVTQGVLLAYYPVFLSDHVGYSLAAAGLAFALVQGLGIFGRVILGWLSDRVAGERRVLAWLCLASGATMLMIATLGPGSSAALVATLSALAGLTVVSWNGVFMSMLAASAPAGQVGEVTAAGTFVLFSAFVVSPLVAQVIFAGKGGYAAGLVVAGLAPLISALVLMRNRP